MRLHNTSLFAQDIWKLSERLTLTYGLRWEINTPPSSVTKGTPLYSARGLFGEGPLGIAPGELWNTRYGNFAPRFGAAWRTTQNTVVRGGFGLFYDLGYGAQIPLSTYYPYRRTNSIEYEPAIPFDPNGVAFGPLPASAVIAPRTVLPGVDPHLRSPLTYQWNVAWERLFGERQALTATYVGAWGTNLLRLDYVVPPESLFAQTGSVVNVTYNSGQSRYSALQVQFLRRMSRGLQALVSYTWSKSSDTISADTTFNGNLNGSSSELLGTSMMDLIAQAPVLAPSDFDRRQLVSLAISWDLPAPRKLGRWLLKGWTLDSMLRAHSAPPLNVVFVLTNPIGFFIQADVVPGQPFWIPNANQPRGRVVNPAAFQAPAGRNGNFPRNSIRGFPFSQADAALRRQFLLAGKLRLEVRAEYFNVLNHPNFGSPDTFLGFGKNWPLDSFGKVDRTFNVFLGGGGTSAGQAKTFAPGGPRSAQFTVRLSF